MNTSEIASPSKTEERSKIYVATHKRYVMPKDRSLYVPVHVGAAKAPSGFDSYQRDDSGQNISVKNPNYCELTAMYWAWKNSAAEIIGLAHYRRYLCSKKVKDIESVLTKTEVETLLQTHEMILPSPRHYYIETNESHYVHAHEADPLEALRNVIHRDYPAYKQSFERIMQRRSAHMFNMLIARRPVFDAYSSWLFDVLSQVESQVDIREYNTVEARVFGYLSELLLDVWVDHNKIRFVERPCVFMEKQNWLVKGGRFLMRKFGR